MFRPDPATPQPAVSDTELGIAAVLLLVVVLLTSVVVPLLA
jgi:hypothetical protein